MAACDATDRSFIVHVWLEEPASTTRGARWRGHITFVDPEKKQPRPIYLADLHDVELVIGSYLSRMGVRMGLAWRWRAWRRRSRLKLEEGQ